MESSISGKKSTVSNKTHPAQPGSWGGLINTVEGKDDQERKNASTWQEYERATVG